MKREEKIKQAAINRFGNNGNESQYMLAKIQAFIVGAKWADGNPQFAKGQTDEMQEREVAFSEYWIEHNKGTMPTYADAIAWADEHPNGNLIKWQTGEPKEKGMYLVTTKDGLIRTSQFMIEQGIKNWAFGLKVVAWCPLSDIRPYKDGTE